MGGNPGHDAVAHELRGLIRIDGHQCHELVAAKARDDVRLATTFAQHARGVDEGAIAGEVSVSVVDVLQMVDIDEDHQDVALHAHRQLERLLRERDERATIGQPRQLVDEQQRLEIILRSFLRGDVVVHGVHATGLVGDAKRRRRDGDPKRMAILVASQRFNSQVLAGGDARSEMLAVLDQFPRNDEVVDVLANGFVLGVAEHGRELAVDPDDVIVLIEDRNRFRGVLEQRREVYVLRL